MVGTAQSTSELWPCGGRQEPGARKPKERPTLGLRQSQRLNKPIASSGICVCTYFSHALNIFKIFKFYRRTL